MELHLDLGAVVLVILILFVLGFDFKKRRARVALGVFLFLCVILIVIGFDDFITLAAFTFPFFVGFLLLATLSFFVGKRFGAKSREDFPEEDKPQDPFE